jgi:ubiquinone/menaquinone biosynthesis C-methylase UbiE
MNIFHRWYCNSNAWARQQERWLPVMLRDVNLGGDVLEIGAGPGVVTEWLRTRVGRLTSIEIDPKLAAKLRARFEGGNVTIVEGDASAMTLPDASFHVALSFTMLHHVPAARQDRLLAEARRVLRPGGVFTGSDSVPSFRWNLYHLFDDRNPVDPERLAQRLQAAGFTEASVQRFPGGFSFRARKP